MDTEFPNWVQPRLFVDTKALIGCRLHDLCQIRSYRLDPVSCTLTIAPDQDKTHRERKVPLPLELAAALDRIKGPTFLREAYLSDSKVHRPARTTKNRTAFEPTLMHHGMENVFREFAEAGGKLRPHGLRKRAITLMATAIPSVEVTAQTIGIDPATARKYYLDAKAAFQTEDVFRKMASVLVPTAPKPPQPGPPQ